MLVLNIFNIYTNNNFNYYFESVTSYGFYPKIYTSHSRTHHRRYNPSSTLIKHIFCSTSDDLDSNVSGVISESISDH